MGKLSQSRAVRVLRALALIALLLAAAAYLTLTGPRNIERYPAPERSPYLLPWPAGITRFCAQSNRAIVSHRGHEEFAYDFAMPVGETISAARAGLVTKLRVSHEGRGLRAPNNYICVQHADGTTAWYLHLQKGGALVARGDYVEQGQAIARSGNVGRSLGPHLHFHVEDASGRLLPVSFADVHRHRGVPRMLFWYRSGNWLPKPMFHAHDLRER